jgi:hypothetical protein
MRYRKMSIPSPPDFASTVKANVERLAASGHDVPAESEFADSYRAYLGSINDVMAAMIEVATSEA